MSWIQQVVQGWKNDIFPAKELKEAIHKMSEERLSICRVCPQNSVNAGTSPLVKMEYCKKCGCLLAKKTRSPTSKCPLNKWEAYMSISEYELFNKSNGQQNNSS